MEGPVRAQFRIPKLKLLPEAIIQEDWPVLKVPAFHPSAAGLLFYQQCF